MATASPLGAHGIDDNNGEVYIDESKEEEVEEIETTQHRGGGKLEHQNEEENNEYIDDINGGRKRRQTAAIQRNLLAQKQMLRDAVQLAKEAGGAIEYHGQLGRKTLV